MIYSSCIFQQLPAVTPFSVRKNNIVSEACNSGRFKRFKKSMRISTINAPFCVRLFLSDDSRIAVAGDGLMGAFTRQCATHKIGTSRFLDAKVMFALLAKFEYDFSMKGGMNSVS